MDSSSTTHHRRSIRLPGFDYASPCAFFVTVVTYRRTNLFGDLVNGEIRLNQFGVIVADAWERLQLQYPYVNLYSYIVMPNHFHGILQILEYDDFLGRGGLQPAPTKIKPLGELVGAFKTISAKQINILRSTPGISIWQRNYYEHVIRDEHDMETICDYILGNPGTWSSDPEYCP